jgi:hypothetical protein
MVNGVCVARAAIRGHRRCVRDGQDTLAFSPLLRTRHVTLNDLGQIGLPFSPARVDHVPRHQKSNARRCQHGQRDEHTEAKPHQLTALHNLVGLIEAQFHVAALLITR